MKPGQYKGYSIHNSIINTSSVEDVLDKEEPFTFSQWLTNAGAPVTVLEASSQKVAYDQYLVTWRSAKNSSNTQKLKNIESVYGSFFQELQLELSKDEKRYIDNIDYSSAIEIEAALDFFTEKVKSIAQYYYRQREQLKFESPKKSLKGTAVGIEKTIYNEITNFLQDPEKLKSFSISGKQRDAIVQEINITTEELYDIEYTQYNNNIIEYDPFIFIDYDTAVRNLLSSAIEVLGDGDISITTNEYSEISLTANVTNTSTADLDSSYFENYDSAELNLNNIKSLVELSTGAKTHYLSAGDLDGEDTVGELFDSSKNLHNILNQHNPTVNVIPTANVKTIQQLGGFFRPQNLGYINYYSFNPEPYIKRELLTPGQIYIYPDLKKGNNELTIPVDYNEPVEYVKHDNLETSLVGEIREDISHIPTFNNYTTSSVDVNAPRSGISRVTDDFDFWSGDESDIWSHKDVHKLVSNSVLPIDARQKTLLSDVGTIYNARQDIYGNDFALIKGTKPLPEMSDADFKEPTKPIDCMIIDGVGFKDSTYQPTQYSTGINSDNLPPYSLLTDFHYLAVRDGRSFLDRDPCDFSSAISFKNISGFNDALADKYVFCDVIDGYMFGYRSLDHAESFFPFPTTGYEQYSDNNDIDPVGFTDNPIVEKSWNGGVFDQVCIPNTSTGRFFKVRDSAKYTDKGFLNNRTIFSNPSGENRDYHDHYNDPGILYIRNADSSVIDKFEIAGLEIFSRYSSSVQQSIESGIVDIDIIQNIIVLRTADYLILDQIAYNYSNNTLTASKNPQIISLNHSTYTDWHVTKPFYNEQTEDIVYGIVYATDLGIVQCLYFFTDINTFRVDTFSTETHGNEIVEDIKSPSITFCYKTNRYYVTFLGSYNDRFCIAQFALKSTHKDVDVLDIFYSSKPRLPQSDADHSSTVDLVSDIDVYDYSTSIQTPTFVLNINASSVTDETVTSIDVDFGDGSTGSYNRVPIINHTSEKNYDAIGSDPKSPDSYLISHTYNNISSQLDASGEDAGEDIKCTVYIHTIESKTPIVKEIKLTQYAYDVLSYADDLSIIDTKVYIDTFGNENTFITLSIKSSTGNYITTAIVRKIPTTREQVVFESNESGGLSHSIVLDENNIKAMASALAG